MKNPTHIDELSLRRRAEAKLALADLPSKLGLRDPIRMLHELQIHQIELQMQNEELLATIQESEDVRERYDALCSFAPLALLTLSDSGRIAELNDRAAELLGVADQAAFLDKSILTLLPRDAVNRFSALMDAALEDGSASAIEFELRAPHRLVPMYLQVLIRFTSRPGRASVLMVALTDETAAKQMRDDMAALLLRDEPSMQQRSPGPGEKSDQSSS
jgi:PAS domain S-box-containing protein